jgi:dipeptidyl aminopeptidase/acylaminoacyl peptidase
MMALKRVSDPTVSPDGKWVVFQVVEADLAANRLSSSLWVVPLAGGDARPLMPTQDAMHVSWAPDGGRFAFASTKGGSSQIWLAKFDSAAGTVTATSQLTTIATEAQNPLWSPDGTNIVFVSHVDAGCEDEDCNRRRLEEVDHSQVKALVFTRLLYRHWNGYQRGRRSHLFIVGAAGGASRDLTPGDYDVPPFSLGGQDQYAFSPDGREICYTSNHDVVEATSTNNDLFLVPVGGGEAKKITQNPASDSTPIYSRDGSYIAYRAQFRAGYESDRFRLMLYNRQTGEKKNLTEDFDRSVGTYLWDPASAFLVFTSENEGESMIYRVSAEAGRGSWPIALVRGFNTDLSVTPDGRSMVFARMSVTRPNEIYITSTAPAYSCADAPPPESGKGSYLPCASSLPKPLTQVNAPVLSQIAMPALESFWFPGANHDRVQGFLLKPPDFAANRKYPVKFLIHGGPENAWGDDWSFRWNPELFAADGYVVIMINFHGSTGYGQKFTDAINGQWGGAPFEDLMQGLDYAEQHYPFLDKDRECALGASYGGYMANWILGHSHRFQCIVTHDGMFNTESAWGTTEELWFNEWEFQGTPYDNRELYRKWSPHLSSRNFKTPTLVIHGQLDYRLDVSEGFQLFTTLQRLKVPSEMLYFPDEGHWVLKPQNSQLWYKTVDDWVSEWTKR